MSHRSGELLLKAIRGLPPEEQDELLVALLGGEVPIGLGPPAHPADAGMVAAPPGTAPALDPSTRGGSQSFPWPGFAASSGPGPVMMTAAPLGGTFQVPVPDILMARAFTRPAPEIDRENPELRVLPVRLPAADYERLRRWSREHDFSMAVIIRTLVERFLESQDADQPDRPKRRARKPKRRVDPDAAPA